MLEAGSGWIGAVSWQDSARVLPVGEPERGPTDFRYGSLGFRLAAVPFGN